MTNLPAGTMDKLIASLRGAIPMAGASCYHVDGQGQPFGHRLDGLSREQLQEYRHRYCETDPFHPGLHQQTSLDVIGIGETARHCDISDYTEGFLSRYGYCDEIELFFRKPDGRIAMGIGLMRDERSGCFRAADLEMLYKIKPFLELTLTVHLSDCQEKEQWRSSGLVSDLTKREEEIVSHVLHGATNREIANRCNVTVATVKAHLFNIFRKTGVCGRTELVTLLLGS